MDILLDEKKVEDVIQMEPYGLDLQEAEKKQEEIITEERNGMTGGNLYIQICQNL